MGCPSRLRRLKAFIRLIRLRFEPEMFEFSCPLTRSQKLPSFWASRQETDFPLPVGDTPYCTLPEPGAKFTQRWISPSSGGPSY